MVDALGEVDAGLRGLAAVAGPLPPEGEHSGQDCPGRSERWILPDRVHELLPGPQRGLEVGPDGVERQGKVLVAPGLEGAVVSAGGVEVEEEFFEDPGRVALCVEVIDQGESLCQDPFHDVSPDPVGGPELVFEGVNHRPRD